MAWLDRSQVLVGQTFLSAGSRNFPVPCRATGKSPAPAGWKACPTLPTPSQLRSSGQLLRNDSAVGARQAASAGGRREVETGIQPLYQPQFQLLPPPPPRPSAFAARPAEPGAPLPSPAARRRLPQRGCGLQPKVGAPRLPWVPGTNPAQPQRGCVSGQADHRATTPLGLRVPFTTATQGSSCLATLGFTPQPRWG